MDMLRSALGPHRLRPYEFFIQGAWKIGGADSTTYLGVSGNKTLNRSLTATGPLDRWDQMTDKYASGKYLAENGFPVPEIRAVVATARTFGDVPTLTSAQALEQWLNDGRNLPVFAKPNDGTMALGSIPIMSAGQGEVDIGGRIVRTGALAREAVALYPQGWLLQEQLRQPAEIEALIGPGIGTVRVVTLWEEDGPQVLYGVWRHPARGTWVDAAIHGKPNVGCALDSEGQVTSAFEGDLLSGRPVTHSQVSPDLALVGYRLAQWPDMTRICKAAHRLYPGHALIGWDIAMTVRGPVISEVNASPLHQSYQRSFNRGFLHKEFRQRLDAARRLMQARAASYKAGKR